MSHAARTRAVAGTLWIAAALFTSGCFTTHHTVGTGPILGDTATEHQWYGLYGLWALGNNDTQELPGAATDYRLTTRFTTTDVIISSITSLLGFYRQTISVEM